MSTEIANWEAELAKYAQESASEEVASGKFFSTKGGILSWDGSPLTGNQMACVILDMVFENVNYPNTYTAGQAQSPDCFSFGRKQDEMEPHETVPSPKSSDCTTCPNNQFGSAPTGRAKACQNVRRLAMIPAGTFTAKGNYEAFDEVSDFDNSEIGFMKLPVMSTKNYSSYVKKISSVLKRPPFGVITRVSTEPDPKSQFKITFEPIAPVPDNLMQVIMSRREEAMATIDFPHRISTVEPQEFVSKAAKKPEPKY